MSKQNKKMPKSFNALTKVSQFRLKLYPKDFQKLRNFYEQTLQFPVIHEWNEGTDDLGVMFDTGSAIIELLSPDIYKPVVGCDISLEVENVQKLWENFKNTDYVVHALRHNEWGDTSFEIKDPEDFQITFFTKDK